MAPRKQRLTREESKARTRSELLKAASRLFLRKGFVATSLSDIAEEAALTKGAVYSNFESKEDLFLALLQEIADPSEKWALPQEEEIAPRDLAGAVGDTPEERAQNWGRSIGKGKSRRRNVALFLEMNAVALRSDRTREWTAQHNAKFFETLGDELREVLEAPDADPELLGLVSQSLFVGLKMHEAFNDKPLDPEVWGRCYRLVAQLARDSSAAPR